VPQRRASCILAKYPSNLYTVINASCLDQEESNDYEANEMEDDEDFQEAEMKRASRRKDNFSEISSDYEELIVETDGK
jgi:hypothetical protein